MALPPEKKKKRHWKKNKNMPETHFSGSKESGAKSSGAERGNPLMQTKVFILNI